jgi:pilus assembly protein Flp/PilA
MAGTLRRLHIWLITGRSDRGASLVEYALLVALIALVCFAAVGFLGRSTGSKYNEMGTSLASSN